MIIILLALVLLLIKSMLAMYIIGVYTFCSGNNYILAVTLIMKGAGLCNIRSQEIWDQACVEFGE